MASKTKTNADKLAEVRQQIADLERERDQLHKNPVSRDEAIQALDRWIDARAGEFERDTGVAGLLRGEPSASLHTISFGSGERSWTPALCALVPDTVRQHFTQRIDAALADANPMSADQRQQRAQEIDQELVKLNEQEERLVQEMHANGEGVTRRGEADPRAILGLSEPPQAPAPDPSETERPDPWQYRDSAGRTVTHHKLPGRQHRHG